MLDTDMALHGYGEVDEMGAGRRGEGGHSCSAALTITWKGTVVGWRGYGGKVVKVGTERQGEGGHSYSAALMVTWRGAVCDWRGCGGDEAGLTLEGLHRMFKVLLQGRVAAWWRRTGAGPALVIKGAPMMLLDFAGLEMSG